MKQTDISVPFRDGEWWYYTRTEEGSQYAINCRKRGGVAGPAINAEPVCPAGGRLAANRPEGPRDFPRVGDGNNFLGGEHADMRNAPFDILAHQAAVNFERRREPERMRIERLPEPTLPLLHRTGTDCRTSFSGCSSSPAATAFWTWWYVRTGRPNILMKPSDAL